MRVSNAVPYYRRRHHRVRELRIHEQLAEGDSWAMAPEGGRGGGDLGGYAVKKARTQP